MSDTLSQVGEQSHKHIIRGLSRKAREAELEKHRRRRRTLLPSPPVSAQSVSLRHTLRTLLPRVTEHSDSPDRQHTAQPVINATVTQPSARRLRAIRPRITPRPHSPTGQQSPQPVSFPHNAQYLDESVQRIELDVVRDATASISSGREDARASLPAARRSYTQSPKRLDMSSINVICPYCGVLLWSKEKASNSPDLGQH